MSKLRSLTPSQKKLLPAYQEKWSGLALSTAQVDRDKTAQAIKTAYQMLTGKTAPIFFVASPLIMAKALKILTKRYTFACTWAPFKATLNEFEFDIKLALEQHYASVTLPHILDILLDHNLRRTVTEIWYSNHFWSTFFPSVLLTDSSLVTIRALDLFSKFLITAGDTFSSLLDFYFSVLAPEDHKLQQWNILKPVLESGGLIFTHQEFCLVCDRPRQFSLNDQGRLHAEGKPAIEFRDDSSFYIYHGIHLPEHYGKFHPCQWQPKWLLNEKNIELRRALIQGIGYERICQELQITELDSWKEYTLLHLQNEIDIEPIYLLKMHCPSTRYIHVIRVPPFMHSAREAIAWVNWDIDPEEFCIQT